MIGLKFISGEMCFDVEDRCELMGSLCGMANGNLCCLALRKQNHPRL